ncbi:MAG: hypothetical protein VKJ02_19150 [Snowella sp.]|nr:hypothetical protein [Snowella sp.]
MEEYLQNGASLGWLIDRKHCQSCIYHPDNPDIVKGEKLNCRNYPSRNSILSMRIISL